MTALLIKILNHNLDNDIVFYGVLIGVVGSIGYSFTKQILSKTYVEKGVQTNTEENLTANSSPIDNVSSIETLSPLSSIFDDTLTLVPTTSDVGIQTIDEDLTPVNRAVIPNPDIVGKVVDLSNAEYIAAKVEQLNALDPFSETPWTPEKVNDMIDTLGIVNNLFI
jgi:hypothetical protein